MEPVVDLLALLRARALKPGALRSVADGEALMAHLFRQFEEERREGPQLPRISRLGACAKQLGYYASGAQRDGKETDLRALLTWATGDAIEIITLAALADALVGTAYSLLAWAPGTQTRLTLRVGALEVPGHPDGVLVESSTGRWVALVSIKSRSSYGFADDEKRFAEHGAPWGSEESLWWQTQGYLNSNEAVAHKVEQEIVLCICKDSGAQAQYAFGRYGFVPAAVEQHLLEAARPDARRVLVDGRELRPAPDICERCLGAGEVEYKRGLSKCLTCGGTGRGKPKDIGKIGFPCTYCPFFRPCWGPKLIEEIGTDYRGRPARVLRLLDYNPDAVTHG